MNQERDIRVGRGRSFDILLKGQTSLCEFVVLSMVLIISAEVICRQIFGVSLQITYEVAGYLMAALTFFGLGISLHGGGLFRVEFVYMWIPSRGRLVLQLVYDLVSLVFTLILDYQLFRQVISSYNRGYVEATILATPLYIPQLVMPIGVTLMIIVLLAEIRNDLRALFPCRIHAEERR
jgi:TRAP-type C4-dicarboxylate transport system permease small subunit